MDYNKIYQRLISRAQTEQRVKYDGTYYECHHILPRCLGGTDDKTNLVLLKADEHYLAHQLLIKLYPDQPQLILAANMMTVSNNGQVRNNKQYKWLREKWVNALKGRKVSDETRRKLSEANKGPRWTDEDKKRMSEQRKGRKAWNKGLPGHNRGKPMSEESKEKMRNTKKANPYRWKDDKERVQKHLEMMQNLEYTDERKEKMRRSMKGKNSFTYIIEGVHYTSSSDVAEKYGIHIDTVRQRCRSKNFRDWQIVG